MRPYCHVIIYPDCKGNGERTLLRKILEFSPNVFPIFGNKPFEFSMLAFQKKGVSVISKLNPVLGTTKLTFDQSFPIHFPTWENI